MQILEDVHHHLNRELPQCKTHTEVENLLIEARETLIESNAPHGQKQYMWQELKTNMNRILRRKELVAGAHAVIDRILKDT